MSPQIETLIVATPRGALPIKGLRTAEGYTLAEFEPELKLMPGDIIQVNEGVITAVLQTTSDFILEVIFHPLAPFAENAAQVDKWSRTFRAQLTTPGSACVASPSLEALHVISTAPDVIETELIRQPTEMVSLTVQVKAEFPILPSIGR